MTDEADRLVQRIEALDTAALRNQQRAESFQRMTEQLRLVEGKASSPDGVVSVVAAPGGTIKSVRFTAKLDRADPGQLSAVVQHTIALAQAEAARRQAEVVKAALGDTELLDRVLDEDERLFGDQRPADPGPAPEPCTPISPITPAPDTAGSAERSGRRSGSRFGHGEEQFGEFSVFESRRTR